MSKEIDRDLPEVVQWLHELDKRITKLEEEKEREFKFLKKRRR